MDGNPLSIQASIVWVPRGLLGTQDFPNLLCEIPSRETACTTIEEAARGLGIPTRHPDGQTRFGAHSMRVAGAQYLSRAGFDTWTTGLLARWGTAVIFGYLRDAPLGPLTLLSRPAISQRGTSLPAVPTAAPLSSRHSSVRLGPLRIADSEASTVALEARIAALEADTWDASTGAALQGRR